MEDSLPVDKLDEVSRAVAAIEHLAGQVEQLHRNNQIHRSIRDASIRKDDDGVCYLDPPGDVVEFGGLSPDLEQCPPELQIRKTLALSSDALAARQSLSIAGLDVDPRRIDIYQLGALLCRLLTNESVTSYLRSPKTKAKVTPALRELIERAMGYETSKAYQDVGEISAAVAEFQKKTAIHTKHLKQQDPESRNDTSPRISTEDVKADASGLQAGAPRQLANSFDRLGEYEIVGLIGHGGMGDVYEGFDPGLRRRVAIKVLPDNLARDGDFVRRFRGEASAAAQLIHPNIVQIFSIGEDQGYCFFAMQFVEGESVAELLARKNRLTIDETLAIVEQTLSGLSAAHQRGLVHRDIKPANLLIARESQRVLLADFGLVKNAGSDERMTATGMIMGTVDYISPEQGRGKVIDARSDLYSIGVLIYRMLSGKLPFTADSPTAMIFQHVYEEPAPLRDVADDVPVALSQVVAKLMSKSPDNRFQSCSELLAELRALASNLKATGNSVETTQSAARAIVKTPDLNELPAVPSALLEPTGGWWQNLRDRALGWFRKQAPKLAAQLGTTQQQVDGAVVEYERRRDELASLVLEAESVFLELRFQLASNRDSATESSQRAKTAADETAIKSALEQQARCEQLADELDAQVVEQEAQLNLLRERLSEVNSKLTQLRAQRDALNARLKAANIQYQTTDQPKTSKLHQWMSWQVGASVCLVGTVIAIWLTAALVGSKPSVMSQDGGVSPIPTNGGSTNLLQEYELGNWRNIVPGNGHWLKKGNVFEIIPTMTGGPDFGWAYPLRTVEEFVVHMTFRVGGAGGIQVVFQPRPDVFHGKGVALANQWIPGQSVGNLFEREMTTVAILPLDNGEWHSLTVEVNSNGIVSKLDEFEPVTWKGDVTPDCICISGDGFQDWHIRELVLTPLTRSSALIYTNDDYQRDRETAMNPFAERLDRMNALRDLSVHCSQLDKVGEFRTLLLQIVQDPETQPHVRKLAGNLATANK